MLVDVTVVDVDVTVVEGAVVEVTVDDVVVVLVPHGQSATTDGVPTATLRQTNASVATVGNVPLGAQMHAGEQVRRPTAVLRM